MWELADSSTVEIHKTYNNKTYEETETHLKEKIKCTYTDTKEMKIYELSHMNLKLPS